MDDVEFFWGAGVDGESHQGALGLPAVMARGAGIDVEEAEARVRHDFEDVGMSADHETYALVAQQAFDTGGIASGIASDRKSVV